MLIRSWRAFLTSDSRWISSLQEIFPGDKDDKVGYIQRLQKSNFKTKKKNQIKLSSFIKHEPLTLLPVYIMQFFSVSVTICIKEILEEMRKWTFPPSMTKGQYSMFFALSVRCIAWSWIFLIFCSKRRWDALFIFVLTGVISLLSNNKGKHFIV